MVRNLALEKEWKIRFEEYKQSGLSIKAQCTKNGFKSILVQRVQQSRIKQVSESPTSLTASGLSSESRCVTVMTCSISW